MNIYKRQERNILADVSGIGNNTIMLFSQGIIFGDVRKLYRQLAARQ